MEFLAGSRSNFELSASLKMLDDLKVLWHNAEDNERAVPGLEGA